MSENKTGRIVPSYSVHCISTFVSGPIWPWFWLLILSSFGRYLLLRSATCMSTEERRKRAVYKPIFIRAVKRMIGRLSRSIALTLVQFSDHLVLCAFLSYYFKTLGFIVQKWHKDASSQNSNRLHRTTVALNRANFVRVLFHMRIFWQVYEPYLIFFFARIFCRFCSRANCEGALVG